jgi:Arm DNA-binding domain
MGIHKLTRRHCRELIERCRKSGTTALEGDGGGLYLRATAAGTASWVQRYQLAGVRHEMGLGAYHTFNLEEAREKSRKVRQLLAENHDPLAERQAAARQARSRSTSKTFQFCTEAYIKSRERGWRSDKHRQDWENSLRRYAYPVIGKMLVSQITTDDILDVLRPQWETRTETLRRVQNRIELVLGWAVANKYRPTGDNPARWRGCLDAFLDARARPATEHFAALHYSQIPELVAALQSLPDTASDALLFCILTATRSKEFASRSGTKSTSPPRRGRFQGPR